MTTRSALLPAAMPLPRLVMSELNCRIGSCVDLSASNDGCAYRVAWAINPHMHVGAACAERAVRQHRRFMRALEDAGARVTLLPFVHGAFDCVFAKDNAVLRARSNGDLEALLARPAHEERRQEQSARRGALERAGFRVQAAPVAALEGGDVVVRPDGGAFLGHGFRSSASTAPALERFIDAAVEPLRLRDPRLYHLDMALAVLHDGTTIACEEAFEPASFRALVRGTEGDLVRIPHEVALGFGINLVEVLDTVVLGGEHMEVRHELEARGKRVVVTPLDELHHAGGSAACLVARIHTTAQVASTVACRATTAIRSTAA